MAGTRVRQDVWKLSKADKWHPTLLWYSKAVVDMQARAVEDPTSWQYQAAIHGFNVGDDPGSIPAASVPPTADRFWSQCQHGSWFFLPWHRMYLHYFEQIIAATVVKLGGDPGWSLPYWNYSDATNPEARKLPPAFTELNLPDGSPNGLFVEFRDRGNDGRTVASASKTNLTPSLSEAAYTADPFGGSPGFGGGRTVFSHGGGAAGVLEITPHGDMHVAVGGFMGAFETAGLDPVFWMHHANIDRLWNVWKARSPQHQNPTDALWLSGVSFDFHDSTGNIATHTANQVVDNTADPLSYKYEDESDPIVGAVDLIPRILAVGERHIPEMVGATSKPVTLSGKSASTQFAVSAPSGPARVLDVGGAPPKIYLNLENVTGPVHHTSYSVYLNLPPESDPAKRPDLLVGSMSTFGIAAASRSDEKHAGSGLRYAYEVGHIVRQLEAKGDWDPKNVRVTFVPDYDAPAKKRGAAAPPTGTVKVGRVSIYHK